MRYSLILVFVLIKLNCIAQNNGHRKQLNLSIGVGLSEGYNLAVKYQLNQMQFGLCYGTVLFQDNDDKVGGVAISIYTHLFGHSKWTERKPWFLRAGASYFRRMYSNEQWEERFVYSSIYFGRDFNISKRVGLAISAGPILLLYNSGDYYGKPDKNSFLVGGDINVFYRFL